VAPTVLVGVLVSLLANEFFSHYLTEYSLSVDNLFAFLVIMIVPSIHQHRALLIGTTDLLFALDSIPAVFGLTQQPFLVFTVNAFALLGPRQLYFLTGGPPDKLIYLPIGLAALLLMFIGAKLALAIDRHQVPLMMARSPLIPKFFAIFYRPESPRFFQAPRLLCRPGQG
jgi:predicted tellurium resistance membrane protein TerC